MDVKSKMMMMMINREGTTVQNISVEMSLGCTKGQFVNELKINVVDGGRQKKELVRRVICLWNRLTKNDNCVEEWGKV
jgi:hypothetical protein